MAYTAPHVSKWFEKDWQFAVVMSKLPLLRPASIAIGLMPLLTKASKTIFGFAPLDIPVSAWITWCSSLAFLASWLVIQTRCPYLIRHYRTYGEFAAEQHSHRWVVWLFYMYVPKLYSWHRVLRETIAKGLSVRVGDSWSTDAYIACPCYVKDQHDSSPQPFPAPASAEEVRLFYPVNILRDLYIPFICDGDRWLLLLKEDDPELPQKEKELFWIHYTAVTKAHVRSRVLFWILFYLSVLLLGFNVLCNVKAALIG